jgi:predicted nucleic acid-binding protein
MKSVFADTFYFFALLNQREPSYAKALSFTQAFRGRIITTGWILIELGDGLANPPRRRLFVPMYRDMLAQPNFHIVPCTDDLLRQGIEFYDQRPDKEWSLTDCLSFVVMNQEKITEALTGDHHFEQAGFTALLK